MHFMVAAILALGTLFFIWIWFVSGQYCGEISCYFSPSYANASFASLGFFCAFLVGTESVIGLKSKTLSIIAAESQRQRKFRLTGIWLMVTGAFIALGGLYAVNSTMIMCPGNGCSPAVLWAIYGPLWALFYAGLGLVAFGEILVLATKFMKNNIPPMAKPIEPQNPVKQI
jgi:hypothetical protein